ncbi:MAG: NFACT RNA binding domain-containing protein [Bdellovibrionota bacterium]
MLPLNWLEIALISKWLESSIKETCVEKVFVPERRFFPDGYLKDEWAIRFSGRHREESRTFIFSVRSGHPYIAIASFSLRPAQHALRSSFGLIIKKYLDHAKLLSIKPVTRERMTIMWFSSPALKNDELLGLVISLKPSSPEAVLITAENHEKEAGKWPIICSSKAMQKGPKIFNLPDGSRAPVQPAIRSELGKDPNILFAQFEKSLQEEAFLLRLSFIEKEVNLKEKKIISGFAQAKAAVERTKAEPDWEYYGDLFKGSLHKLAHITMNENDKTIWVRNLTDFKTDQEIEIQCNPRLLPKEQMEAFYHQAKRKKRRLEEALSRVSMFGSDRDEIAKHKSELASINSLFKDSNIIDWDRLEKLQDFFVKSTHDKNQQKLSHRGSIGKIFRSVDGFTIIVGRNKNENMELTFKYAKGNDMWLHIRGRPGAHVVIMLDGKRSASLQTLLDAAQLAIRYSGGEKLGKVEVDYTFIKFVRRIKTLKEVTYTQNKTLLVESDVVRLKRLLETSESNE